MSALTFRLRNAPPERLDLSPLVPEHLAALSVADMGHLAIGTSRMGVTVGDVFDIVAGDATDMRIIGGSSRLDRVGERMAAGRITVEGDVGQRLAFGMTGGAVHVQGAAGPFAASAASGGLIRIDGDSDERAGGAVHGAMHGLNGASLVIRGNAGPRLGDRMRRGLVIVGGRAERLAGSRMIAGTIVASEIGDHAGYGMRRGTILARQLHEILPSFVDTGTHRLTFLGLLRRAVADLAPDLADLVPDEVNRHAGDMATIGKGEILTAVR